MGAIGRESKRARECEGDEMKGQKNEKVIWQQGVCASEEETSSKTRAPQLVRRREYRNARTNTVRGSRSYDCAAHTAVSIALLSDGKRGAELLESAILLALHSVFLSFLRFLMSAKGGESVAARALFTDLTHRVFIQNKTTSPRTQMADRGTGRFWARP